MSDPFANLPAAESTTVSFNDDNDPPPPPPEETPDPNSPGAVFAFPVSSPTAAPAAAPSSVPSVVIPEVPPVPPPPPADSDDDEDPTFTIIAPPQSPPAPAAQPRPSMTPSSPGGAAAHTELIALAAALSLPSVTPTTISNANQLPGSPSSSSPSTSGTEPVAIGNRSVSAPSNAGLEPVSVAGSGRAISATIHRPGPSSASLSLPGSQQPRLSAAGQPPTTPRREAKEADLKSFAGALLPHNFDIVSDQVEGGIYSAKRVASFLRKFCAMEEEHARKIQTALAHESTKVAKLSDDHMKISTASWAEVQRQFEKLTRQISSTAAQVMTHVVVPLQEFHAAAEEKRKALLAEERKASSEMAFARDAVVKGLMQCDKLIQQAKEVVEKEKKESAAKKKGAAAIFSRMTAAVTKSAKTLTEQSHDAAIKYQAAITAANRRQTIYLEQDLPKIFNAMQQLEQQRLDAVKLRLTRFMTIQNEAQAQRAEIIESMGKEISELSTERDMGTFIDDWVREHGPPLPSQPYVYGLQCTPEDIKAGRLEGSNPNSVFRTNLDQVMNIQKENYPTLEYPAIMKVLIESIKGQGGYQAEGIFRISVAKTELDELQAQFEQGNYEVKNSTPHAPAALLKAWLRSLTDPLVPPELYNEAIECAKDKDCPPSKVLSIFNKLPPITRKVLEQLAWMCQEISSEKNAETTRMNMENLAIVFAPSLLRCPSEDPLVLLGNSKFETRFTVVLFKTIPAPR